MKGIIPCLFIFVAGIFPASSGGNCAHAASRSVEQWTRFEDVFTGSKDYANPVQDVEVTVEFSSPSGNKRTLLAFWDGGRMWRVRFSPDMRGKWTYKTSCSDKSDNGLNNKTGSFECRRYKGDLSLFKRGELRLSKNRRYFEHSDGTPFFFLSDTVWCGPLLSDMDDWEVFLKDRVEKDFTAIQFVMTQWRMAKTDADGNAPPTP